MRCFIFTQLYLVHSNCVNFTRDPSRITLLIVVSSSLFPFSITQLDSPELNELIVSQFTSKPHATKALPKSKKPVSNFQPVFNL